jgi:nucleoside-diphosphate-sugar epimerase
MRVLVTGAASHLGRVLLPRLRAAGWSVTGLDRAAPPAGLGDFPWVRADVRDPDLARHLRGADAVVHLAFAVQRRDLGRRATRADMRSVNVDGSANVFAAARAGGARHIVHASSAAVYGAWPDNPVPLTEACPRRPQPGFAYSEDKAAVEAGLDAFEAEGAGVAGLPIVTRLRLHAIVGPGSRPLLNRIAATPFYIRAPQPVPVQCLWEADAAAAVEAALAQRASGAFNIAAPEPRPLPELIARHRRWCLGIPYRPARAAQRLLARFTDVLGDPGWLAGLRYPLVLDCARARNELHWRPERSVSNCIDSVRTLEQRSPTPRSP